MHGAPPIYGEGDQIGLKMEQKSLKWNKRAKNRLKRDKIVFWTKIIGQSVFERLLLIGHISSIVVE